MFLAVNIYINAKLWNIHQLCVLQVFIEKKKSFQQENKKESGQDRILMKPAELSRNQQIYVAKKSRLNSRKK